MSFFILMIAIEKLWWMIFRMYISNNMKLHYANFQANGYNGHTMVTRFLQKLQFLAKKLAGKKISLSFKDIQKRFIGNQVGYMDC